MLQHHCIYFLLPFHLFDIAYILLLESIPEEYQVLLAEHNSLVEKDVDELAHLMAATMKQKTKVILAKQMLSWLLR